MRTKKTFLRKTLALATLFAALFVVLGLLPNAVFEKMTSKISLFYKGSNLEKWQFWSSGNSPMLAAEDTVVERTKKQLMMLDDLYKTVLVLITEHYVRDPATLLEECMRLVTSPAATASKAVFKAMEEKGWHEARLLGYTDVLLNVAENTPKKGFETRAKEKILAGAASYSEVVEEEGKRYVQMATALPVVIEKCVLCHSNFKGKAGAIGALSYKMTVIE